MTAQFTPEARHEIVAALNTFLSDTAIVYFKAHSFHWNVEGANFYGMHKLFEELYLDLWKSMDVIAERVRAYNDKVYCNFETMLQNATIEETDTSPTAPIMALNLRKDFLVLSKTAHAVGTIAEKHGDRVTTDLMAKRAAFLDKGAWMLQSSLTSEE
jgi:starvation-inducible DNA-binding protein